MSSFRDDTNYGIGRTLTDIADLRLLGVGIPDQVIYDPSATHYERADQTRVGDGFARVTWIWDNIALSRLSALLDFLDGADYAQVYINTDVREGSKVAPSSAFKTFYAIMWRPILSGEEGVPVARSPYAYQTVAIQFRKLIEQGGLY